MATSPPVRLAWHLLLNSQSVMSPRKGEVRAHCLAGAQEPEVPCLAHHEGHSAAVWTEPGDPRLPLCGAPELSRGDSIPSFKTSAPLPETWRLGKAGAGRQGGQQLRLQLSLPCPLTA